MADAFREAWGWGLPQAAIALGIAGALGIATVLILHKRGPRNRLAPEGPAYAWAWLYVAAGVSFWLVAGYAWLQANPSSTVGIAVIIGVFAAALLTPVWYGQLSGLGAAAARLGARSMHTLLVVATLAGAASGAVTPIVCALLLGAGLMSDDGAVIPVTIGVIPLGSAIAALGISPVLPVGSFGKGHCMGCGYDLAGLPTPSTTDGGLRCPECGCQPQPLSASEPAATASTPARS